MVMGAVMVGGIITGKPPVNLEPDTPIARLDERVQRLRAARQLAVQEHGRGGGPAQEGPGQREMGWRIARRHRAYRRRHDRARGGRGPAKINYVAFRGVARPRPPSWAATSP